MSHKEISNIGALEADTIFIVIGNDTNLAIYDDGGITTTLDPYTNAILFIETVRTDTVRSNLDNENLVIEGRTVGDIFIRENGSRRWSFKDNRMTGEANATIVLDSLIAVAGNILVNSNLDLNTNDILDVEQIIFDDGTNKMALSGLRMWEKEYWFPDLFTDTIPFFEVDSSIYPFGVTITNASILTSVDGVYALQIRQYTAADPPVASNWIDTLNVGSTDQRAASTTFTDATVPRGAFIYINTPDNDIDWIKVKIGFFANES